MLLPAGYTFRKSGLIGRARFRQHTWDTSRFALRCPPADAIHVEINDGRGEKRKHLADDQAANDGDAD